MLAHAARHSPYYRDQEWASRVRAGEGLRFSQIPITSKTLVRTQAKQFYSPFVPPEDGTVETKYTSGSTSEPMLVYKTARHFQRNAEENQRLQAGWDFSGHRRRVKLRYPNNEHPAGTIEEEVLPDNTQVWHLYSLDASAVFDLLRRTSATWLNGPPSIILGALERSMEAGAVLPLRHVLTISEVVPDKLRELVSQIPGCRLVDFYGAVETGLIAAQCPDCDAYHPADRHLVFEVVTDEGNPAPPGQMGRVVVTPLFNAAMPLVRYEIGDYAIPAKGNGCPRSPSAFEGIVGREKNLFRLKDGTMIMPVVPPRIADGLGIRQFKVFQTTATDVELHYIPRTDGIEISEQIAQDIVDKYMSPSLRVRCRRVSDIPRAPSGKFLTFERLF